MQLRSHPWHTHLQYTCSSDEKKRHAQLHCPARHHIRTPQAPPQAPRMQLAHVNVRFGPTALMSQQLLRIRSFLQLKSFNLSWPVCTKPTALKRAWRCGASSKSLPCSPISASCCLHLTPLYSNAHAQEMNNTVLTQSLVPMSAGL